MRRSAFLFALALVCAPPSNGWALGQIGMQISNLSDFTLGSWGISNGAVSQSINVCVYGLEIPSLLAYQIKVSSSPSGYVFSGPSALPYSVFWNDTTSGLGTQLTDNTALINQINFNILATDCGGVPNAKLTLQIAAADLEAAPAGNYTGSLTLLLSPN